MAKAPSQKPVDKLTYEKAFAELEAIITRLEADVSENPLEQAMSLFERGQALAKHCSELLDSAELNVRELSGDEPVDFESGE